MAERGGLDDLEREHRALHARGRDVDPEQVEHGPVVELEQLLGGQALELVGEHRGRGLGDRAAVPVEGDRVDLAVLTERELEGDLVAAQRVEVVRLHIGLLERPVIVWVLVVLEDVFAVELFVHGRWVSRLELQG
jgi:hypothetical protein